MTPLEWAVRPLQKYAVFSGRAPRAEYWWFVLFITIGAFALGLVDTLVFHGPIYGNLGPLGLILSIATVIPRLAVLTRRLHDTGTTGWWAVVSVPDYILTAGGSSMGALEAIIKGQSGALLAIAGLGFIVWAFAVLFVLLRTVSAGDVGTNDHGPDPYGSSHLEEVFA